MPFNPYSAPASRVGAAEDAKAARKPLALLAMQVFMIGIFVVSGAGLLSMIALPYSVGSGPAVLFKFLAGLACSMAILVASWRRKPVVRLLGGAAIVLLIAASIGAILLARGRAHGPGYPFAMALLLSLEIYWLYAFAFSLKARRYLGLA